MFNFLKKKMVVVTHNGSFHADEVFACATLLLWAEKNNKKIKIIRTRDPLVLEKADIVVDVGMIYDPKNNRFDHHQKGGAGEHAEGPERSEVAEGGIPYASFGLVWKKYGEEVCGSFEIAKMIEQKLVIPIDARDNGVNTYKITRFDIVDYRLTSAIHSFNLTWQEDQSKNNEQFIKVLQFVRVILEREIVFDRARLDGASLTREAIIKQNIPEILILEKDFDWEQEVSRSENIKLVVYPSNSEDMWAIKTVRSDLEDFKSNRVVLPKSWLGISGEELAAISGVKDAIYCAKGGWFAKAKSKEGAIVMAEKALQAGLSDVE